MKLYVWTNVLTDYTPGIAFALAHDVDEARRLVKANVGSMTDEFDDEPQVFDSPVACHLVGGG